MILEAKKKMFKVLEKEKRMVIIVKEKRIGVDCGIYIFY